MAALSQADLNRALSELHEDHQRIDVEPNTNQRLGSFTVICLILNKTVGKSSPLDTAKALLTVDMFHNL
jgi:hypothetical protein